jgi:hypothetical protein
MTWYADLHSHTSTSDGALSAEALVELAARHGVRALAVTDHDTTGAVRAASVAAREHSSVEIIAGIEISAWFIHEIHILGLFVEPDEPALALAMTRRVLERRDRVREIAARLATMGVAIDPEAIVAEASGRAANVGRPHVARALLAAGHVATVEEAFCRFLGREAPAYVPVARLDASEAISLIHGAGGVASLAHPGLENLDAHIPDLAALGLDAIEVRHPAHDPERVLRYASMAGLLGLLATGGADFHEMQSPYRPGDQGVSAETLSRLREKARAPPRLA